MKGLKNNEWEEGYLKSTQEMKIFALRLLAYFDRMKTEIIINIEIA